MLLAQLRESTNTAHERRVVVTSLEPIPDQHVVQVQVKGGFYSQPQHMAIDMYDRGNTVVSMLRLDHI